MPEVSPRAVRVPVRRLVQVESEQHLQHWQRLEQQWQLQRQQLQRQQQQRAPLSYAPDAELLS